MSLLGDAGGLVQKVTDKATDNPLGKGLDALASGLSGGGAGSGPPGNQQFIDGGWIDQAPPISSVAADPKNPGAPKPDKENVPVPADKPPQFLHLAYAHQDDWRKFVGGITSRGVAMRDALIREDVLLFSFVKASQSVLTKAKEGKGNVGAMLDTVGSLLGGKSQAKPGPEAFDALLTQIRAASTPINVDSFGYTAIHKAGVDFGKIADGHNELCKQAFAKDAAGGGMGLPSIPSIGSLIPGAVPDIVAKIPEYLFKVQDAYVAMYRVARVAYEWELMKLCHDYSLQSMRECWQPTFEIWTVRSKEATQAAQAGDNPSLVESQLESTKGMFTQPNFFGHSADEVGPGKAARDGLKDAQDAVKDVRTSGEDKAQMLAGLLGTAEDCTARLPPEAVATMAKVFALLAGDEAGGKPSLAAVLLPALKEALGETIGGVAKPVVDKVVGAAIAALERVYTHIHAVGGAPVKALILAGVHEAVAKRIVGLLFHLVLGRDPGVNDMTEKQKTAKSVVDDAGAGSFGQAFSSASSLAKPGDLKDEGANKLAELVTQFLESQGHLLDGIIYFVAEDIATELQDAYEQVNGSGAVTMEVYIGRLPMLAATTVRNLLFPIYTLVLKVFGMADKLGGAVWDPVSKGIGKVTDVVTSAKDKKDDVNKAGKNANAAANRVDQAVFGDGKDHTPDPNETPEQRREREKQQGILQTLSEDKDNLSHVDASKLGQTKQDFDKMKQDGADAPGKVTDAINGDPESDASGGGQAPKDTGTGPLASSRVNTGAAKKIEPGEIEAAKKEVTKDEKDILAVRTGPSTAPAAPAGPKMPSLSDIGGMF